jgi:hypothetical protein
MHFKVEMLALHMFTGQNNTDGAPLLRSSKLRL